MRFLFYALSFYLCEDGAQFIEGEFCFKDGPHIVSISIDPARDSVSALLAYATKLGVANTHWDFLTGEKDSIYPVSYTHLDVYKRQHRNKPTSLDDS